MGGAKYLVHFRNQINQQNANASLPQVGAGHPLVPDVLNINQQQPLPDLPSSSLSASSQHATHHQAQVHHDSDVAAAAAFPPPDCNFNVNTVNLELNELRPKATKMLPKGSTGGSKRGRPIRHREQNNLVASCGGGGSSSSGVDLNLASTASRQDSKLVLTIFVHFSLYIIL